MAATFEWQEDNGTAQSGIGGLKGGSRTGSRTECNWKFIDDSTTAYTSAPIAAGTNSYTKHQFGKFSGSYNEVSNGKWAHTAGVFSGSNVQLYGSVAWGYVSNRAGTLAHPTDLLDLSDTTDIASGSTVYFAGSGPENQAGMASAQTANPAYSQYFVTQVRTTAGAQAGDTTTATFTLRYDEN